MENADPFYVLANDDWFYVSGDDEVGPFSREQLKELHARGEIGPDTMVRKRSWLDWERAATVRGLFQVGNLPSTAAGPQKEPRSVPTPPLPPSRESMVPDDVTSVGGTDGNEMPPELKKRRMFQGARVYAIVSCLGLVLVVYVLSGIVLGVDALCQIILAGFSSISRSIMAGLIKGAACGVFCLALGLYVYRKEIWRWIAQSSCGRAVSGFVDRYVLFWPLKKIWRWVRHNLTK